MVYFSLMFQVKVICRLATDVEVGDADFKKVIKLVESGYRMTKDDWNNGKIILEGCDEEMGVDEEIEEDERMGEKEEIEDLLHGVQESSGLEAKVDSLIHIVKILLKKVNHLEALLKKKAPEKSRMSSAKDKEKAPSTSRAEEKRKMPERACKAQAQVKKKVPVSQETKKRVQDLFCLSETYIIMIMLCRTQLGDKKGNKQGRTEMTQLR